MYSFRTTLAGLLIVISLGWGINLAMPIIANAQQAAATPAAQDTAESTDGCVSWSGWSFSPTCWWQSFMSMIGSTLLSIGGGILLIAGYIFDQFLQLLVIDFQKTITGMNLFAGIEVAWQLFRDLANIAIIGVFVFVAIMTIWGSAEYGAKRLVARVLIVAVLINFSLLFTRLFVESTNFISGQFARSMPGNAQEIGVAQSFLRAFGIDGVWSGTEALTDRVASETDSGWAALLYGIVGSVALLTIAGVLLYGAIMIAARALLLVFMLITSSLAFASFLLPQWSDTPFLGWTNWWSNLLKATIFGPMLMVFLWIAMQILSRANVTTGGAGEALGTLADDPTKLDPNAWRQLIFLIIGTGILFIGIRASSKFSASIAVMGSARGLAGFASLLPVSLATRFGASLGQQTIGRANLLASQRLLEAAKQQEQGGRAQKMLDFGSRKFMQAASVNFNALNTSLAKQYGKDLNARNSTLLTGKNLKGFVGSENRKVEKAAELGDRMKMTDAEALKQAIRENPALGAKHEETKNTVSSSEEELGKIVQQQAKMVESFEKNIQSLGSELKKAQDRRDAGDASAQSKVSDIERQINDEKARHQSDLNREESRIEGAEKKLQADRREHAKVINTLQKLAPQSVSAAEIAQKAITNGFDSALERRVGMGSLVERRAEAVAKKTGDDAANKRVRDLIALTQPTSTQPQTNLSTPNTPPPPTNDNHSGNLPMSA